MPDDKKKEYRPGQLWQADKSMPKEYMLYVVLSIDDEYVHVVAYDEDGPRITYWATMYVSDDELISDVPW